MSFLDSLRQTLPGTPVPPADPALPQAPASSPPRQHSVQCIGPHGLHRMAYTEWGDPANPRVLVCAHGLTRNGRDFDDLARAMAPHYRVVCPEVVGRGRSPWLPVKDDYQLPTYVADMVTLIARLGGTAAPTGAYQGRSDFAGANDSCTGWRRATGRIRRRGHSSR